MNEKINEAINNFDNEIAMILRQSDSTPNGIADASDGTVKSRLISIANAIDDRLGAESN